MARAPRPAAPALVLLTQYPTSNRHCAPPGAASRKHQSGAALLYWRRLKPFQTGVEMSLDAAGLGARATLGTEARHSSGEKCRPASVSSARGNQLGGRNSAHLSALVVGDLIDASSLVQASAARLEDRRYERRLLHCREFPLKGPHRCFARPNRDGGFHEIFDAAVANSRFDRQNSRRRRACTS